MKSIGLNVKKKLLIVNKMYYPDIGGVETVVKQYAEYLTHFFDVTVLVVSPKFNIKSTLENINEVKVIRCSSFGTFLSMPVSFSFLVKLFTIKKRSTIFIFMSLFPLQHYFLFFQKNKYIVTWHSDIVRQKFFKKVIGLFQHLLCTKADIILTTSPNLATNSNILSHYKDKIEILPLSIDEKNYPSTSYAPGRYLLYIGRLSYYKGLLNLIDSYELSSSEYPLYIVGNGDPSIIKDIKTRLASSSKEIVFINKYVSEEEKINYLKNCRALIFPSTHNSEAFGIIQLEAMILGKPVINTALPTGVPWVSIHEKTGLTIEPGNNQELAMAINKLNSNQLVTFLGNNAQNRVRELFSDSIILHKLLNIYKRL